MRLLTASCLLLAATAAPAMAQGPEAAACDALTRQGAYIYAAPASATAERVAAMSDTIGQVVMAGSTGYLPAQSDAALSIGDRVILLDDGRATLTANEFRQEISGPAAISVSLVDGCAAISLEGGVRTFAEQQVPPNPLLDLTVLSVVGGGGAIIGTIAVTQNNDSAPASP